MPKPRGERHPKVSWLLNWNDPGPPTLYIDIKVTSFIRHGLLCVEIVIYTLRPTPLGLHLFIFKYKGVRLALPLSSPVLAFLSK